MRLSDIQGEAALDALCDMLEPAARIMGDPEISKMAKAGVPKIKIATQAIRTHKADVVAILAASEQTPVGEYKFNLLTLPLKMLEILSDPMVDQLFSSQGQTGDAKSSVPASENTVEN